jgi:hypothetical protein
VLLGAAGVGQLTANLLADRLDLSGADLAELTGSAEQPGEYWATRSALPWA